MKIKSWIFNPLYLNNQSSLAHHPSKHSYYFLRKLKKMFHFGHNDKVSSYYPICILLYYMKFQCALYFECLSFSPLKGK